MDSQTEIRVGEKVFEIAYERSRKNSSSVHIKGSLVRISLGRFVNGKYQDELIEKFIKWAEKKLAKLSGDFVLPEYRDGGRIVLHNKVYDLEVIVTDGRKVHSKLVDGSVIKIFVPRGEACDLKYLVEKLIMKDQTSYLKEVIDELNLLHFQEIYKVCRFKRTSSRFGSCSSKKNINIAYKLLFAPREVFRYVCVHELAHLKEMNHSSRFWALVEAAMPDYKKAEKWLRENGFVLD